MKTHYILS